MSSIRSATAINAELLMQKGKLGTISPGAYADILVVEGDPLTAGGRIDIRTGEVWPQAAIEYALETGEEDEDTADDPERWLAVHGEGSREGYRDMELFIASVEDPGRAERLAVAIKGPARFAASRTSFVCWPGELERWHALSEERQRGRARSWLAAAGYRAGRQPPAGGGARRSRVPDFGP